jgi:hypothetical protein
MAESMVISGLVSKRAEVAGEIVSYNTEIIRIRGAFTNLDGSIKLLASDFDLRTLKTKRTIKSNQDFAKGEGQRMTVDVMREAGITLNSREINERLSIHKSIEPNPVLAARIQKCVITALHRQDGRLVSQVDSRNAPGMEKWVIA